MLYPSKTIRKHHATRLTTLESQRSNVNYNLWSSLKDDEQDANGARHAIEIEFIIEFLGVRHTICWARKGNDVRDTLEESSELGGRLKRQSGEERGGQLAGFHKRFGGLVQRDKT